jgi:hypothetical protein
MADKALDVYLNDHLAGAIFGSDLARHLTSLTEGTALGEKMRDVAAQVEQDRETLSRLMDAVGTSKNPVKQATTWLAEKASRLKLSGASSGEDQLGIFLALETLSLGVGGKAALWRTLLDVQDRYPGLQTFELDALLGRAQRQLQLLEDERIAAGRSAMTG